MSLSSDALLARFLMRRRLILWRLVALGLVGVIIGLIGWRMGSGVPQGEHVAIVNVSGVIMDDDKRDTMFENLANSAAKAVIVQIDSPGGGVTASEKLYASLRELAAKKPVVAQIEQVAASGGYIAALGAERIFAYRTSITGSIGVLFQYPNVSGLLDKIGVNVESIKSSPLKAAPNGLEPTSPEARAAMEAMVLDSFAWFKGLVAERRKLSGEALDRVSDGRVFTGAQALEAQLIDAIGSKKDIRNWLEEKHNISKTLKEYEWKPVRSSLDELGIAKVFLGFLLESVGLPSWGQRIAGTAVQTIDAYALDGVLAIWQPVEK